MTTTARDVMNAKLVTLRADASALEAARHMRDSAIGDVIVSKEGTLHGIVTDRDLVVRCLAEGRDPEKVNVGDLCTTDLVTVSPDDDPKEAVKLMSENAVRRIPVVDNDRVVGIISLGDLAVQRDRDSALGKISAAPPNK